MIVLNAGAALYAADHASSLREGMQLAHDALHTGLAREKLVWTKPFSKVLDESNAPFYEWFNDGELNVSYNCLDRHLPALADKPAIIFEADDGSVTVSTYADLHARVCQLANALTALGVQKGDRVVIYLAMSIEAVTAMQACARIGATHSVVFGGFSAQSLRDRIHDAGATLVITADGQKRGGKAIPLKPAVDEALSMGGCESIRNVVVFKRTGQDTAWTEGRDVWWHDAIAGQPTSHTPVPVNAVPAARPALRRSTRSARLVRAARSVRPHRRIAPRDLARRRHPLLRQASVERTRRPVERLGACHTATSVHVWPRSRAARHPSRTGPEPPAAELDPSDRITARASGSAASTFASTARATTGNSTGSVAATEPGALARAGGDSTAARRPARSSARPPG
jgi:hypothetical protein